MHKTNYRGDYIIDNSQVTIPREAIDDIIEKQVEIRMGEIIAKSASNEELVKIITAVDSERLIRILKTAIPKKVDLSPESIKVNPYRCDLQLNAIYAICNI